MVLHDAGADCVATGEVEMKIEVTQEDISNGIPDDCDYCPIALAAKRAGMESVLVYNSRIIARDEEVDAPLSIRARRFVRRFDAGLRVKPFNFEVRND